MKDKVDQLIKEGKITNVGAYFYSGDGFIDFGHGIRFRLSDEDREVIPTIQPRGIFAMIDYFVSKE